MSGASENRRYEIKSDSGFSILDKIFSVYSAFIILGALLTITIGLFLYFPLSRVLAGETAYQMITVVLGILMFITMAVTIYFAIDMKNK